MKIVGVEITVSFVCGSNQHELQKYLEAFSKKCTEFPPEKWRVRQKGARKNRKNLFFVLALSILRRADCEKNTRAAGNCCFPRVVSAGVLSGQPSEMRPDPGKGGELTERQEKGIKRSPRNFEILIRRPFRI
jgi:hypothetical protein